MTNNDFKHFLSYEQSCFDGIEYGITELYYKIDSPVFSILMKDTRDSSETRRNFPLPLNISDAKTILSNYLVEFFSVTENFAGQPVFENSSLFTKEEVDLFLIRGDEIIDKNKEIAIELAATNEFIVFLKKLSWYVEPAGGSPTNWYASCPSGGNHSIMISTESNEWGCGYCIKEGGLDELKQWIEEKKITL